MLNKIVQKHLLVKNIKKNKSLLGFEEIIFCFSWDQVHSKVIILLCSNLNNWTISLVKTSEIWGKKILEVKTSYARGLA